MPIAGPELSFQELTHQYKLNGQVIPSVTQLFDASGLVSPFAKDPFYCQRGTAVHKAAALIARDTLVYVTDIVRPFVECFVNFQADMKPVFTGIEVRVYNVQHWFSGTLDFHGYWSTTGRQFLLDLKHSDSLREPDLNTAMQTAAYKLAGFDGNPDIDIWGLMVNPKLPNGYRLVRYDYDEAITDFLAVKRVLDMRLKKRLVKFEYSPYSTK